MSAVEHLRFENAFQHMLIHLATRFINHPVDQVDESLTAALRQVVEFLGADRATIHRLSDDKLSFAPLYYWQTPDSVPVPDSVQIPQILSFVPLLERGEIIQISNREFLPEDSSARYVMNVAGVKATVAVPIFYNNALFGFVSTGWRIPTDIHPETPALLQILAQIFLNAIERKDNEARIRKLNEDLEKRVDERTQELRVANEQLQHEIHERQHAEALLRTSEERYRIISELISDYAYVYSVAPDGTLSLEWATSEAYTRLTGFAFEENDTSDPFALYHPDDADLARQDVARTTQGERVEQAYRIITKSGDIRWIYIRRYPVWDEQKNRVIRFYGVAQDITPRKQVEESLRLSEERYRVIGELISDFAFLYRSELDGSLALEWLTEESYQRVTGYTLNAVAPPFQLYHPEDDARARQDIARTLRGEQAEGEYRIHTKSGEERWIYIRRYPLWDEQHQRVERFYGVAQDITLRKQTEAALRLSEERYRRITGLISDYAFLYRVDAAGRLQSEWMTQDSYVRLTGFAPDETEGTYRLYHPDDADRAAQDVDLTLRGQFTENEYRIITRSGEERWIYMRRYPLWDESHERVIAYYGVAQNITGRKQTEEALRLSEERYRRITELISDYAFLYRSDEQQTLKPEWITEDSFFRLTGHTVAEVGGAFNLYHPDDEARAHQDVERTLAGEPTEAEYRIITHSGEERWIYMRRYPVWNKTHDRVEALYGVAQDITRRRHIEIEEREQRTLAEALLDTAQALNSTFDLNEMLSRILVNIDRVVPHDISAVMLIDAGVAAVVCVRETGSQGRKQAVESLRLTIAATASLRQVYESGQPLVIADTQQYPDWRVFPGTEWIRCNVCIPVRQGDDLTGFLTCDSASPNFFTPKMVTELQAFAHQIALAMTNARLYQEGKELAIMAERQRLARDLHDAVTQTMFSASVIAETLPRFWEQNPEQVRQGLARLQVLTRGAVAEMRALLLELRPEALEGMNLPRLIGQLVDAFSGQTGIVPVYTVEGERSLPQAVKITLYRIAQESFNNISKHARASEVSVKLTFYPVVKLMIVDNGRGFIPEQIKPGSLGLKIMRERAGQIQARLSIQSEPGKKTTITVEWNE